MDFVRSYFFMNATLTSCPLFFILLSLLGRFAVGLLLHPPKNWATGQSCIHKEVTSYKIHTLKRLSVHAALINLISNINSLKQASSGYVWTGKHIDFY